MKPRELVRRSFPFLLVAAVGFLAAYVFLFFFVFRSDVVPDVARVPSVVGMSYDDAAAALDRVGFRAQRGQTRYKAGSVPDRVLEQSPPGDSRQKRGATVMLAVSLGQKVAVVPTVAGLSQQQARLAIENAGLVMGRVVAQTGDQPRGLAMSSTPAAGDTLQLGAPVEVVLSAGPAAVAVPVLVGQSLAQARGTLDQLGLKVGSVSSDTSSFEQPGTILSQRPEGGRNVPAGGAVSFVVSQFPPVVPQGTETPLDTVQPPTGRPVTRPPVPTPVPTLPPVIPVQPRSRIP